MPCGCKGIGEIGRIREIMEIRYLSLYLYTLIPTVPFYFKSIFEVREQELINKLINYGLFNDNLLRQSCFPCVYGDIINSATHISLPYKRLISFVQPSGINIPD